MKYLIQTVTNGNKLSTAEKLREVAQMINECTDAQLNHIGFKEYGETVNIQILEVDQGVI